MALQVDAPCGHQAGGALLDAKVGGRVGQGVPVSDSTFTRSPGGPINRAGDCTRLWASYKQPVLSLCMGRIM
jgi:hypothetical protein